MDYRFHLTILSDIDYEELLSNISRVSCNNEKCTIATISRESGVENMKVEVFFYPTSRDYFKFPFNDFLEMLERAKENLDYPSNVSSEDEKHSD